VKSRQAPRSTPARGQAPPETPGEVARAIERAREIDRRVRDQVFARLAFPWRFEDGQAMEPMPPLSPPELEALTWELDRRYRQPLQDESEI
jgi:hypothetical protein